VIIEQISDPNLQSPMGATCRLDSPFVLRVLPRGDLFVICYRAYLSPHNVLVANLHERHLKHSNHAGYPIRYLATHCQLPVL